MDAILMALFAVTCIACYGLVELVVFMKEIKDQFTLGNKRWL